MFLHKATCGAIIRNFKYAKGPGDSSNPSMYFFQPYMSW